MLMGFSNNNTVILLNKEGDLSSKQMNILFDKRIFLKLYNCSFYSVDDIPVEDRRHFYIGISFIILFVVFELIYFPCMWVMSRPEFLRGSCYKLMFLLGICGIFSMPISGLVTGYAAITGDVYCSHPIMFYLCGMFGLSFWGAESMTSIILALNRCVAVWDSQLANRLFNGTRIYFWIAIPITYAFILAIFTPPLLFSALHVGWFYNPHFGYYNDYGMVVENTALVINEKTFERVIFNRKIDGTKMLCAQMFGKLYINNLHVIHNLGTGVLILAMYGIFFILLRKRLVLQSPEVLTCTNEMKKSVNKHKGRYQKILGRKIRLSSTFIQVFLIVIFHASTSFAYVYMQFFKVGLGSVLFSSYAWIILDGLTPVILLTLNNSIKSSVKNSLKRCCIFNLVDDQTSFSKRTLSKNQKNGSSNPLTTSGTLQHKNKTTLMNESEHATVLTHETVAVNEENRLLTTFKNDFQAGDYIL